MVSKGTWSCYRESQREINLRRAKHDQSDRIAMLKKELNYLYTLLEIKWTKKLNFFTVATMAIDKQWVLYISDCNTLCTINNTPYENNLSIGAIVAIAGLTDLKNSSDIVSNLQRIYWVYHFNLVALNFIKIVINKLNNFNCG